ncbi:MAG: glycoside hydrolase family 27 protein [Edaphobacter sp.]
MFITSRWLSVVGLFITLSVISVLPSLAHAESPVLAPTPPMGWNSWDAYGTTVQENEVKSNADYMAAKLAKYGWQYIVIDIEWYATNPKTHGYIPGGTVAMDRYGRFIPVPNRFPSSANGKGFSALADYIHGKGLKMGVHIMRGIPRKAVEENLPIEGTKYHAADIADKQDICHWKGMEDTYGVDMTKPGAQAYYDSIARLYASWKLDYIKADDMSQPFHGAEIHALSVALRKTGRPIVLSLSPGPAPIDKYPELKANAQLWRISGDFWDSWPKLRKQFDLTHAWECYVHPGGWPDADMLPMGKIGLRAEVGIPRMTAFTPDEQQTMMTLWSIFRSPLMFGGDLPSNDSATLSLISNPEVLSVDQASTGGHQVYRSDSTISWLASKPGSSAKYVALFNISDQPSHVVLKWSQVGIEGKQAAVRDLWAKKDLGTKQNVDLQLKPHSSVLYRVTPQ